MCLLFIHMIPSRVAVGVNAKNDVQVPQFVSPKCPVPVPVLQRVMEEVVKDTVPDGQCAPFEFCCFGRWIEKVLGGVQVPLK